MSPFLLILMVSLVSWGYIYIDICVSYVCKMHMCLCTRTTTTTAVTNLAARNVLLERQLAASFCVPGSAAAYLQCTAIPADVSPMSPSSIFVSLIVASSPATSSTVCSCRNRSSHANLRQVLHAEHLLRVSTPLAPFVQVATDCSQTKLGNLSRLQP